jgi:hypothetical protein
MKTHHHNSNLYFLSLDRIMNKRSTLDIHDKINIKLNTHIPINGALRFYNLGLFKINRRSLTMNN